jgi:hypothetical protein
MSDKIREYRNNAEEAERQARLAKNDTDKAYWLSLMAGWLSLLPKPEPTEEERFDQHAEEVSTHQEKSASTH